MTVFGGGTCVNFFAITYNGGLMGLSSIQLNTIFSTSFAFVAYLLMVPIINKLKRKKFMLCNQSLIILSGITLISFRYVFPKFEHEDLVESLITCFIINSCVIFNYGLVYILCTELFPIHVRGMASGVVITLGKVLASYGQIILQFSINFLQVNAMSSTSIIALVSLPVLLFIPETLVD